MKKTTVFFAFLLAISAVSYSFITKPSSNKIPNVEKQAFMIGILANGSKVHDHVAEVTTV